jgi:hypothetical protein
MPRSLFSGTTIEIKSMFENVNPQSLLNSYSNLLFFNDVTNTILRFNELFVQGDFTNLLIEYEKNADKNWLVSDILLYIKKNKFDYYKHCVYVYKDFIFCKKDTCSQFNIFWGLLSSEERRHFVQIRS